jgi:hypothetical protein
MYVWRSVGQNSAWHHFFYIVYMYIYYITEDMDLYEFVVRDNIAYVACETRDDMRKLMTLYCSEKYRMADRHIAGYKKLVTYNNDKTRRIYDKEVLRTLSRVLPQVISEHILTYIHPRHKKYYRMTTAYAFYSNSYTNFNNTLRDHKKEQCELYVRHATEFIERSCMNLTALRALSGRNPDGLQDTTEQ